jgi:hypothetical protein
VTLPARHLRVLACAAFLSGGALHAQGTTQLSGTATLIFPYSPKWTFVGELNPSTVIDGEPTWHEMVVDVGAERNVLPWMDLVAYGYSILTDQTEQVNTTEFRLRVGAMPFWRPRPRWFLQGRALVENRWIYYHDGGGWDYTVRARVRGMTRYAIRRANEYQPGAIFLRADVEGYLALGDKATERYFDKVQVRTGGGYRFDRRNLGELYLVRRASEMTFLSERDNSDWVIELKFTHILARPTPPKPHSSP